MSFSDEDLKHLKESIAVARASDGNLVFPDMKDMDRLLARLLDAENVIMVHGEDGCTACQKWRLSCGLPKNKSV